MTNGNSFDGLQTFGLCLKFTALGRGSGFAGAAWRGLMGQALFDAVCRFPAPACSACPAVSTCAYPNLFKPLAAVALPAFWLHGWQRSHDGWTVGLRWLGANNGFAVGEWLAALAHGGANLSFGGAPARLDRALSPATDKPVWRHHEGWISLPAALDLTVSTPPPPTCQVRFITPLVSKHIGDPLFGALHTRLQRLVQQFGDGSDLPRPAAPWRCEVVAQKERRIPLARRLLSGTEWELILTEIDADAWRLLRAGTELHAGGQTGMGCGQYEILPSAEI
jgi:hypothetical protein